MPIHKKTPKQPKKLESTSGVVQVGEIPPKDIGRRLRDQNRAIHRFLKRPENSKASKVHEERLNPLVTLRRYDENGEEFQSPAAFTGMGHFSGTTKAIVLRMDGHSEVDSESNSDYEVRGLNFKDLYRAYKHTPHQPASLFLKYVIHRINNIDDYEDPTVAVKQDQDFLRHHKQCKASDKNAHVTAQDLHHWLQIHEEIPNQLLAHKAALHTELNRGVGLNIRDIGGKKYIALSRGLDSDVMNHEHALSSWSDLVNTGFGKFTYHAWVPLNDLWYSYQYGPRYPGGDMGHENEYLVSPIGRRYEATPSDVKGLKGHGNPIYYENATDEELESGVDECDDFVGILNHPNAGPRTYQAALNRLPGDEVTKNRLLATKFVSSAEAMASSAPQSVQNPNLSTEELNRKILDLSWQHLMSSETVMHALSSPKATADTARTIFSQCKDDHAGRNAMEWLADSNITPPDVLDKILDRAIKFQTGIGGNVGYTASAILRNPNHTTEQADRIFQDLEKSGRFVMSADEGKYSSKVVEALDDIISKAPTIEPSMSKELEDMQYFDRIKSKEYIEHKERTSEYRYQKDRGENARYALEHMGRNRYIGDDTVEALINTAVKYRMPAVLRKMALRQHGAPYSELSQLRLIKGLDALKPSNDADDNDPPLAWFSRSKGLAPLAVQALAVHPDWRAREGIYLNKDIDPEVLAQAWPKNFPSIDKYLYSPNDRIGNDGGIYYELAKAIRDRRNYAEWKLKNHLIKPWPKNLAKGETDWWPIRVREWLSSHAKDEATRGYYYRCQDLESARAVVHDQIIPVGVTDEILDGQVVFAHPAKDHYYHEWENDPGAGEALVYFETDSPPLQHDDRVYWPHDVVTTESHIVGIRPDEPWEFVGTLHFHPEHGWTVKKPDLSKAENIKDIEAGSQLGTVPEGHVSLDDLHRQYKVFRIVNKEPQHIKGLKEGVLEVNPAIPSNTLPGEDILNPRVCVSKSIYGCVAGIMGDVREEDIKDWFNKKKPVFSNTEGGFPSLVQKQWNSPGGIQEGWYGYPGPHRFHGAQIFALREVPKHLKDTDEIVRAVPDAHLTKESWLTQPEDMEHVGELNMRTGTVKPFHKRELDSSLGYVIDHRPMSGIDGIMVRARMDGQVVGKVYVNTGHPPHIYAEDSFVYPSHRRKGLASAMYAYAEKLTGKKMVPSTSQLDDGRKLWEGNAQQKQFGKEELKKHTFNGEKDYRPDEAGDPKFPFMGGAKKEQTEVETEGLSLPGLSLQPGEHATALAQLGHNGRFEAALAAACFLARKSYDSEKFQQGMAVYGDERRAALHAVGMSDSEKNLKALDAVISFQRGKEKALAKAEEPLHIHSIQSVKPGNEDALEAAEAVGRALKGSAVVHLKLSGKHTKGALACKDPQTGMVLLLKPPGGKQSPAAGARDGSVGQARREACFWHIADSVHLGGVIPRADLVLLNAQEWSAIKLLGSEWRSLDERNREKQYKGREVLGPYLTNGQVHRWAILDGVLANSDSHGQNLLVNEGGSVALIDHGASFCGPRFDPAHDSRSFIPFYLRVWGPDKDFKKMTPEERIKFMPRLGKYDDDVLKRWLLDDFSSASAESKMHKYGIDQIVVDACLARLESLRAVAKDSEKNLSEAIDRKWAGLEAW